MANEEEPKDYIPKSHHVRKDLKLELPSELFQASSVETCREIQKVPLASYPDKGFVLKNVLTPAECQWLIQESERWGYQKLQGYQPDYRNNLRIVIESYDLASLILDRIKPYVEAEFRVGQDEDLKVATGLRPDCASGSWSFYGLNECWRFCRYDRSGHFGPHLDGDFVRDNDDRSFYTFMLYLNEGFEGGETNFLKADTPLQRDPDTGLFKAKDEYVLERLKPETGQALVFFHAVMHEGAALAGEQKYILRSELMYKLQERAGRKKTEKELEALALFREAEDLESYDPASAAQKYRRAFKLDPELARLYKS